MGLQQARQTWEGTCCKSVASVGLWRFSVRLMSLESPGFKCACWEIVIASLCFQKVSGWFIIWGEEGSELPCLQAF